MKWGRGEDASKRVGTLTRQELLERGVTLEIATAWQEFYENEARRNSANKTAPARAELMKKAVSLLEED